MKKQRDCFENRLYWLESPSVDDKTKAEIAVITDEDEIRARFGSMIRFGTSGLRGLMHAGLSGMNVYTVRYATQGVAELIRQRGGHEEGEGAEGKGVVIAYDPRNNSRYFAEETASVLAANGIHVWLFEDLRPTPELSFAVRELGAIAGINITASHNTKEYNGYKVYWADGAQLSPDNAETVAAEFDKIDIFEDVVTMPFDEAEDRGLVEIIGREIDEKYMEAVISQSCGAEYVAKAGADLRIVYTPFHGAGCRIVPEVLHRIGCTNIIPVAEQMVTDGNFPTVRSPNPEEPEGFRYAIGYAERFGADMIIGTDPDSDRCGAAVRTDDGFKVLSGNQMACLMLDYLIRVRKEQGTLPQDAVVIRSIVSTPLADRICEKHGIEMMRVLTGFKFIGEKIKDFEENGGRTFLFGFEESIGFLSGTYTRDKDAVVAAMLMAEAGCFYKSQGKSVYEGLQELYNTYGYYLEGSYSRVFEGACPDDKMQKVMAALREKPPRKPGGLEVVKITDYLRDETGLPKSDVLYFDLEDGCTAVIRPSGTEPKIKSYVMARGRTRGEAAERRDAISADIGSILAAIDTEQ